MTEIGVYYVSVHADSENDAIRRSTQLAIEKAIRGEPGTDFRKGRRIYAEVHFYFICWHAIHERIKVGQAEKWLYFSRGYTGSIDFDCANTQRPGIISNTT